MQHKCTIATRWALMLQDDGCPRATPCSDASCYKGRPPVLQAAMLLWAWSSDGAASQSLNVVVAWPLVVTRGSNINVVRGSDISGQSNSNPKRDTPHNRKKEAQILKQWATVGKIDGPKFNFQATYIWLKCKFNSCKKLFIDVTLGYLLPD